MSAVEFFAGLRHNYGRLYNEGRGHFDGYQGAGHWENVGRWKETARTVQRLAAGSVLDMGCGRGTLVEELRALGVQAYGVDLGDDVRTSWGVVGNAIAAPFAGPFDTVVALDLIEHVPTDYQAELWAELRRLTDRILVVTVPTEPPFFQYGSKEGHRNHYISGPPKLWRTVAEDNGFRVEHEGEPLAMFGAPFTYGPANYPFVFSKGDP